MKKLIMALSLTILNVSAAIYPDLPIGIKNGAGTIVNDTFYIGLGAGNSNFFALDLKNPTEWKTIASFSNDERTQAIAAAVDGKLYVLGGAKKNEKGELQLINDVHRYDPESNTWERIPTRSPQGLVGASAVVIGDKIWIVGGVNEAIFNGYFQDMTAAGNNEEAKEKISNAYFSLRPQDYFFNTNVLSYQPSTNQWRNEGRIPFSGRAGSSVTERNNTLTVMSGEIKPGLRTSETHSGTISAKGIKWKTLAKIPHGKSSQIQEGLAGAYSGYLGRNLIIMGGANFPGSTAAFKNGNNYAHAGLSKAWQRDIFSFNNGQWRSVGELPVGMAYGVSANYGDHFIIAGGETEAGEALTSVYRVKLNDEKVVLE